MRDATSEEIQKHVAYVFHFTFKKANGKNKNVHIGPIKGESKEKLIEETLASLKERFSEGTDFTFVDCYEEFDDKLSDIFFWDWKQVPNRDDDSFFIMLDKQLAPFGAEVVHLPFDGDAVIFFVGKKTSVKE
jgi:hypothetical protein